MYCPLLDENALAYSLGVIKLAIFSLGPFIFMTCGVHHLVTHMKNVMKKLCVLVVTFLAL